MSSSDYHNTMLSVCTWYPLKSERNISQTQTLHLQYLYALNFHLMKVLSLLFFTERLYKASNTFMQRKTQVQKELIAFILYFQSLSWPLEAIKILFAYFNHLMKAKSSLDFNMRIIQKFVSIGQNTIVISNKNVFKHCPRGYIEDGYY